MIDYREQYLKSSAAQQQYGVTPGIADIGRRSQLQSPQTSTGTKGGVGVAAPPQINPITGQAFSAVNLSPPQAGSLFGSKGGAASSAPVIASEPSKLTEAESEELAEVGIDVPSSLIEAASQVTAPVAAPQTGMSAQPDIVQAAVASQLAPGSFDPEISLGDRLRGMGGMFANVVAPGDVGYEELAAAAEPTGPRGFVASKGNFDGRYPFSSAQTQPAPPLRPPVDRLEPGAIRQTIEASVSEPAPLPPPAQPPTLPPFSSPKLSKDFTDNLRDQLSPPPPVVNLPPPPSPPMLTSADRDRINAELKAVTTPAPPPPVIERPPALPPRAEVIRPPLPPPPPPPPVPPPMMTPADLREAAVPMAMPVPDIIRAAATPITQPIGFDVAPPPVAPLPPPMLPVAPAPVSAGSMAGSKGGAEPQLADASFVGITPPANIPALPTVAPALLPKTPRRRIEAVADPRLPRFIPPPGI